MVHNITTVTAPTYSVLETDYFIAADSSANAITLTLPHIQCAGGGATYVIKDTGGNSAVNAITIDGYQTETIDGQASFEINSPYGAISLFTNGTSWFIY